MVDKNKVYELSCVEKRIMHLDPFSTIAHNGWLKMDVALAAKLQGKRLWFRWCVPCISSANLL